jgi:DNA-binding response OmpR family regulator
VEVVTAMGVPHGGRGEYVASRTPSSPQGPGTHPEVAALERPFRILVVDPDAGAYRVVCRAARKHAAAVVRAETLTEADRCQKQAVADLLIVAQSLPDGEGIAWAGGQRREHRGTQMLVLTDYLDLDAALTALRAGAADMLTRPLAASQVNACLEQAIQRAYGREKLRRRVRRLQRTCRKLQRAHDEVAAQVDVLCTDLVTAYQELAEQMQQVTRARDYASLVREELDLEQMLRKTLEFLLERAGPTNAAIFLPASLDEFSLGGYVNYDWTSESPELLLQLLADRLAPHVAAADTHLHLTDDVALADVLDGKPDLLTGCHVLGVPCRLEDEPLAVVILFREAGRPFEAETVELCQAIAPMIGEYLARIIRIHHRHLPDPSAEDDDQGFMAA